MCEKFGQKSHDAVSFLTVFILVMLFVFLITGFSFLLVRINALSVSPDYITSRTALINVSGLSGEICLGYYVKQYEDHLAIQQSCGNKSQILLSHLLPNTSYVVYIRDVATFRTPFVPFQTVPAPILVTLTPLFKNSANILLRGNVTNHGSTHLLTYFTYVEVNKTNPCLTEPERVPPNTTTIFVFPAGAYHSSSVYEYNIVAREELSDFLYSGEKVTFVAP